MPENYEDLAQALRRQNVDEGAARRLAVYGTLAPGKSNHGQLGGLRGTWTHGAVRGTLRPAGWGQNHGYPGLIWNPWGPRVAVQVFESPDLEQHWARLDAFEGEDYRRLLIPVEQDGRLVAANIYALSETLSLEFGEREIHLWSARLDDEAEGLAPLLSEDERARAERFHFDRDRQRFIAARGWLRILLGRYRRMAPESIPIAYGPKGKPYLEGGPRFNVSHSGDLALMAFCADEEVGVDLEAIRDMDDAEAIVRRTFSPVAIEEWLAAPAPRRQRAFFDLWTRHEAVGKALGEGISGPLPPAGEAWSWFDVSPTPAVAGTVAIRGDGWRICAMGQCSGGNPDVAVHRG